MTVRVVLYQAESALPLYAGPSVECPPLPRVGDQICVRGQIVFVEAVLFTYPEPDVTLVQVLSWAEPPMRRKAVASDRAWVASEAGQGAALLPVAS